MSGLDSEWRGYIRKATFKIKYNLTLRDADIAYKSLYEARDVPVFKWMRENPGEWTNDGDRMIAILVLTKWGIKQTSDGKAIESDSTTNRELAKAMIDNISKPPVSYITSCKEIATDEYFKWIMKNPTMWTNDDRNTVIFNMEVNLGLKAKKDEIVGKTGLYTNEILHMILQNCVCDAGSGSNCGCTKGMNKYFIDKLEYDKKLLDNTLAGTNDQSAKNKYDTDLAAWQGRRDTYRAEQINHRYRTECGGFRGGPPACPNGYDAFDAKFGCNVGNTRESQDCKYSQATIDIKMAEWDRTNPRPQPPVSTTRQVDMPKSNIVCCGIDFNNINADTVEISKIKQECSLKVIENNVIVNDTKGAGDIGGNIDAAKLPTSQNYQEDDDEEEKKDDNTWLYILIAVIILIVCSSLSISSSLMMGGMALTI